jgi:hypothetical protein
VALPLALKRCRNAAASVHGTSQRTGMACAANTNSLKATRIGICGRPQPTLFVEYKETATGRARLWRVTLKCCVANRTAEDVTNSICRILPAGLEPSSLNHGQMCRMVAQLQSLASGNPKQKGVLSCHNVGSSIHADAVRVS